ncbi:MAG: sortase [Candidatus Blackburnbacteria bacterium]|nr:sortase [Candidatus Blackburnbacteria bacterium]
MIVIYEARQAAKSRVTKHGNRKLGLFLLGASFAAFLLFIAPVFLAEVAYRITALSNRFTDSKVIVSGFGQILWLEGKGAAAPLDWNFGLAVPRLGINTKVLHTTNTADENSYKEVLTQGAAHAQETALPNEPGITYIFGHSTNSVLNISRYNAVFYPLQYIKEGDDIIVFYLGEAIGYKVQDKKIVDAEALGYMLDKTEERRLVLQTCWPPGTTWKRLVIVAKPIEESTKNLVGLDFKSI